MFVGHLGAGLAAKRAAPELSLGVLFLAAMLLDLCLWVFVLLGVEQVHIPESFAAQRYLTFTFPYSHGLIASLLWSSAAFAVTRAVARSTRAALLVGAVVFSHFVLDVLVHVTGLPLVGSGSYRLGLGLWRHMGVGLVVECAIAALGWWLYLGAAPAPRAGRRGGLGALVALAAALTVVGGLATTPPPGPRVMAVTSLGTIALISGLAFWLDRPGRVRRARAA
jgi:hypothetical protein